MAEAGGAKRQPRLSRGDIVTAARGWLGTPYRHQASIKGVGADCLGIVRGVWSELYGTEPEVAPPYTRDWAEATGLETMIAAADRHFRAVEVGSAQPGDVLVFRLRAGYVAKHAAILTAPDMLLHATEGCGACEVPLSPWWRRRIARVYSFPGVSD